MKTLSLFFLIVLSIPLLGQEITSQSVESLELHQKRLETEIKIKTDSLNFLIKKIEQLKRQDYLRKISLNEGEIFFNTSLVMDGHLRKSWNPMSEVITIIKKYDTVRLTDYNNGYWIANKGEHFGYISEVNINETDEIRIFKEELIRLNDIYRIKLEKQEAEKLRLENEKAESLQRQKESARRQKIIAEFGKETGQKLINGYYWIGMTKKMAIISLGEPRNINRTVGEWGVHEQLIYYKLYLYFENGTLTSYQQSE